MGTTARVARARCRRCRPGHPRRWCSSTRWRRQVVAQEAACLAHLRKALVTLANTICLWPSCSCSLDLAVGTHRRCWAGSPANCSTRPRVVITHWPAVLHPAGGRIGGQVVARLEHRRGQAGGIRARRCGPWVPVSPSAGWPTRCCSAAAGGSRAIPPSPVTFTPPSMEKRRWSERRCMASSASTGTAPEGGVAGRGGGVLDAAVGIGRAAGWVPVALKPQLARRAQRRVAGGEHLIGDRVAATRDAQRHRLAIAHRLGAKLAVDQAPVRRAWAGSARSSPAAGTGALMPGSPPGGVHRAAGHAGLAGPAAECWRPGWSLAGFIAGSGGQRTEVVGATAGRAAGRPARPRWARCEALVSDVAAVVAAHRHREHPGRVGAIRPGELVVGVQRGRRAGAASPRGRCRRAARDAVLAARR